MKGITWTIRDLYLLLRSRQKNEFDGNIAVSGDRGNGKSTVINKLLYRFKGFDPWKHQVYSRKDVVNLLQTQTYGIVWDDEAVNSSYKRDFGNRQQQELIKILTAYRDSYNIFTSAIPSFFSLDKDLRDLYFVHLHVIERGIAVVHMPLQGRLYSQDRWDAKYNGKIEEKWSKKMQDNPDYKPPYHKLTTFRGYLFFTDLTEKQRKLYKLIKKTKRAEAFKSQADALEDQTQVFFDRVLSLLLDGKLSKELLQNFCLMNNRKYNAVKEELNKRIADKGEKGSVDLYLTDGSKSVKGRYTKKLSEIDELVPSF